VDTSKKIQVSKVIDAPAETIYDLLADPTKHTEIDGAGMLRGVEGDSQKLLAIGQTFTMNMHQESLGDYRMVNSVTALVPGARIGWSPTMDPTCDLASKLGDMKVGGHTFTYDLREVDGGTEVTETYDWMSVHDPEFEKMLPVVTEQDLQTSLDNLASAVHK
jgi:hypothetical protein